MVDAGRAVADFLVGNVEVMRQLHGRALHRVAEADLLDRRIFLRNRPGVDRHRVHVLQHDRLGADGEHVLADLPQVRHGAKPAHDAADAERVGDRLAQSRTSSALSKSVTVQGSYPPIWKATTTKSGAGQRLALVGIGLGPRLGAQRRNQLVDDDRRFLRDAAD